MFGWTIRPRLYENGISAAYLSDMAAKGWYFRRLGWNIAVFRKGVPAKVRYAVDVMDAEHRKVDEKIDSPHIQDYLQLCEESGWKFLDNDGALYVFVAEHEEAAPMQTDPAAYKASILPLRKGKLIRLLLSFLLTYLTLGNVLWIPHRYLAWEWGPTVWLGSLLIFTDLILRIGYVVWTIIRERRDLSLGQIPEESYGRWPVWFVFVLETGMLLIMLTSVCQMTGIPVWLGTPGLLLQFLLLCALQEGLQKLGWRKLHLSREGADWLGQLPFLLLIIGMSVIPMILEQQNRLPVQTHEPPAGWQPVVEAADFGWDGERMILRYDSSFLAQTYEMWEGTGKEQLRSILYTSEIGALLDSFYKKGPLHGDWWSQGRQEVREPTELETEELGIEEGMSWHLGDGRWHYLMRAGNQVLYLRAGQALSEEQLATAAQKLCEVAR